MRRKQIKKPKQDKKKHEAVEQKEASIASKTIKKMAKKATSY